MRHLPECKQRTKAQNYERKGDGTDDFTELPSDLFHPSPAPFVESDHSRHHGLHRVAEGCENQVVGNGRRILCAMVGSFHSGSACGDTPLPRHPKAATGRRDQTEEGNRKDALAVSRRGPSKEGRMPVPDDRVNFKRHWSCGTDSDKDSRSR